MDSNGDAPAQRPGEDPIGELYDGKLYLVGMQLGQSERDTGHVLLGPIGRQVRPEGYRSPDHGAVPDQLGDPVGRQNRDGADGVPVLGRTGRQRGGHQQPDVRGRNQRRAHEGRPGLAVHTHVQFRRSVRVRVRHFRGLRHAEHRVPGGERAVRDRVVLRAGIAGVPDPAGRHGRREEGAQVAARQGERQGGGGGVGRDDAPRGPADDGQVERLPGKGHVESAADRRGVPGGHAAERHQHHTDVHGGDIPGERQRTVAGHVHDVRGRGASDRLRTGGAHGEAGRPQVLPDTDVHGHRGGADHHRVVLRRAADGPQRDHRLAARAQHVAARDRVLHGPGHGAVHHLHGDIPGQRAQHVHVRANVLEQRARVRHRQGVPARVRVHTHIRLLLAAGLRVPGRRAVHVLLRARDQGQVVRGDPEEAAAVVPGPAAPQHRRPVRGRRHHVADGVQQSGGGQRHQRPQRVHRERSDPVRGTVSPRPRPAERGRETRGRRRWPPRCCTFLCVCLVPVDDRTC
uniref:Uncharacterized protein n=1 Tax=Sipha flava TaxID=143950 RepID=A0A2S2QBL0_9HEMI